MLKIEEKYLVAKHVPPPIDMKLWKEQWPSLYKEAGGDGVRPAINKSYPNYIIYPTGHWSLIPAPSPTLEG